MSYKKLYPSSNTHKVVTYSWKRITFSNTFYKSIFFSKVKFQAKKHITLLL